jgi:UDP:flavonoid glycosyltransferase YjiC (YdhE family)
VPNIVLPFTSDQPFWGQRVYKLGAGPKPIPIKRLSIEKLSQALDRAVLERRLKEQAKEISTSIQQENGLKNAIEIIEEYQLKYSQG